MANIREIQSRINSVKDTMKITNAMYMISSSKLTQARKKLADTEPYFYALQGEISRILRHLPELHHSYFNKRENIPAEERKIGSIVITADKGLAGMYNQNVIKKAEAMLVQYPDTKLFVVGEYGRQYFARHTIPVERSFLYTAQNPTMQRAREISEILLELFRSSAAQKIFVLYTDMKNGLSEETRLERLLPFHRGTFASAAAEHTGQPIFEFTPSVGVVLDSIIPSYVSGYIYSALVDSFCSEQNARMTAMRSAGQNAEKLLTQLSGEYNRLRQAAITREITEISSGAKAQKQAIRKKQNAEVSVL